MLIQQSAMPIRFRFQLDSLDQTDRLAAALSAVVEPGDIVLLSGDLGTGKTTLVRRTAIELGVNPASISSPTFTVMNQYDAAEGLPIIHMDAYRLAGQDEHELLELGFDDDLRTTSVTFIEWGERVAGIIERISPAQPALIHLTHEDETSRDVTFHAPKSWADRLGFDRLAALCKELDSIGSGRPGYPFKTERDQLVDLYHWFGESYKVSRPIEDTDADPS